MCNKYVVTISTGNNAFNIPKEINYTVQSGRSVLDENGNISQRILTMTVEGELKKIISLLSSAGNYIGEYRKMKES